MRSHLVCSATRGKTETVGAAALGRRSAQFYSGLVEKWRARQDETGHSYVIVTPIEF